MPELPEVETIRMQLEKAIVGLRIKDIEVLRSKSFTGEIRVIRGIRVIRVRRRAKIQFIELENGVSLAIHLKMTGQLIWREPNQEGAGGTKVSKVSEGESTTKLLRRPLAEGKGDALVPKTNLYDTSELPNKYTRVVINFSNGSKLYFNDLRVFGWIKVMQNAKIKMQNDNPKFKNIDDEFDKYGPEAIDESTFTLEYFRKMLSKTSRAVKLAILDQEKLAGVGNIYANEALFRAGIGPGKEAKKLRNKEIEKLRNEIINVLREAIKYGGTSDKDEAFRQIDGSKGGYQKFLQVYNREGLPCGKCGELIKKVKIGGRGSYFCSKCQK